MTIPTPLRGAACALLLALLAACTTTTTTSQRTPEATDPAKAVGR